MQLKPMQRVRIIGGLNIDPDCRKYVGDTGTVVTFHGPGKIGDYKYRWDMYSVRADADGVTLLVARHLLKPIDDGSSFEPGESESLKRLLKRVLKKVQHRAS